MHVILNADVQKWIEEKQVEQVNSRNSWTSQLNNKRVVPLFNFFPLHLNILRKQRHYKRSRDTRIAKQIFRRLWQVRSWQGEEMLTFSASNMKFSRHQNHVLLLTQILLFPSIRFQSLHYKTCAFITVTFNFIILGRWF